MQQSIDPTSWQNAVRQSPLWTVITRAGLDRLATTLVAAAQDSWSLARQALADKDLAARIWCDPHFCSRVLQRSAMLLDIEHVGSEEALLLLVAPFVREAVHAAGFTWIASADLFDLKTKTVATEPRHTLQQVHRGKPRLVRRAQTLEGEAKASICQWMAELALSRMACLWRRGTSIEPLETLFRTIEQLLSADASMGDPAIFRALFRISRAIGADPDAIDTEGGVGHDPTIALSSGHPIRVSELAHLLCVASAQALEPRVIDEVAVDHVGRDKTFFPASLVEAMRAATWLKDGDRHVLVYPCHHPVIDFALRDLVERANSAQERARAKRDAIRNPAYTLLDRLPKCFTADEVQPISTENVSAYPLPHVRFRLDEDRIRELLMGESLYGDPSLAIRELYQNALDACRYRQARAMYLGRQDYRAHIVFRQATDTHGRLYIECDDNGVGMTKGILERVFAIAGRRFRDMPDFLEERARWETHEPVIELYPNSQFGIGVLSYFMLAEEVVVWTRRFEADGHFGSAIAVQISSASGLFRIDPMPDDVWREQQLPDAGTRVRLYLHAAEYEAERGHTVKTSCTNILKSLLWIAEFETHVEEDGERFTWSPGTLTAHEAYTMAHVDEVDLKVRPTTDPDIFWSPEGRLLCDGIRTDTHHDCAIVNLRGKHLPEISVHRKEVRAYDEAWVERILTESWQQLIDWADFNMKMLWQVEKISPRNARLLFASLSSDTRVSYRFEKASVLLRAVGCFLADSHMLLAIDRRDYSKCSFVQAFRMSAWAAAGGIDLPRDWPESSLLEMTRDIVAQPGDAHLLNATHLSCMWRTRRDVSPLYIKYVARLLDVPASRVRQRVEELAPLGLIPPSMSGDVLEQRIISEDDWRILTARVCYGEINFGAWNVGEICSVGRKLDLSPGEILTRLDSFADLGVERPQWIHADVLSAFGKHGPSKEERAFLAIVSNDGKFSWASFFDIARECNISPRHAFERMLTLSKLGVNVPAIDPSVFDAAQYHDGVILGWYQFAIEPWLNRGVPRWHVLQGSMLIQKETKMTPADILRRVDALSGFGLTLPPGTDELLDISGLLEEECELLNASVCKPAGHAMRVAQEKRHPLGPILQLAVGLGMIHDGFAHRYSAKHGDYVPDELDMEIIREHSWSAHCPSKMDRIRSDARFQLWYLTDAAFEERFERLRPLIQYDDDTHVESIHKDK